MYMSHTDSFNFVMLIGFSSELNFRVIKPLLVTSYIYMLSTPFSTSTIFSTISVSFYLTTTMPEISIIRSMMISTVSRSASSLIWTLRGYWSKCLDLILDLSIVRVLFSLLKVIMDVSIPSRMLNYAVFPMLEGLYVGSWQWYTPSRVL